MKRKAGRPSPQAAEQKHRQMVVTALEEFARCGFHAASLRNIANKAEVSNRTLYNYYPDKLALFEACLEFSGNEIRPVLPDLNTDLHSALVTYVTSMQRQLFAPQAMRIAALIYREGAAFDRLRQIARVQFERHQVEPVARILERHDVSPEQSRIYATQFVAMAFGEWQRRLLFGEQVMIEAEMLAQAELATRLFLPGLRSLQAHNMELDHDQSSKQV